MSLASRSDRLCVRFLLMCLLAVASSTIHAQKPAVEPHGLAPLKGIVPAVDCSALLNDDLSAAIGAPTHITEAKAVPEGKPAPFCGVKGYVDPAIRFEVRLPLKNWTQRYVQTGCGGLCGNLNIELDNADDCAPATNGELVLASTDMGHGRDLSVANTNAQIRIDFAYRAEHVTALVAKALIQKFYGQAPKYSYFVGCSDGGREGLMEAQRYPEDFNGVVSGDAALDFITQNTFFQQWARYLNKTASGKPILTTDKLPILHQAALDACDGQDGVKDGLISNPLECHFDPIVTQCKVGQDSASCLTPDQIRIAREIFKGAHDTEGNKLTPGGPFPGSELNWAGQFVFPADTTVPPHPLADSTYKYLAFQQGSGGSTIADLKFDREDFAAATKLHALYDASDSDLSAFVKRGGKLIEFHGWADPGMSPLNTIAYYTALQKTMGKAAVDKFARLYLFPGGNHCLGGLGPFDVDLVSAMMAWVEGGHAPYALISSHRPQDDTRKASGAATPKSAADALVDRTRPVYPYPITAKYKGTGDSNDAKNFVAGKESVAPPALLKWLGESFYTPHEELWCTANGSSMDCAKKP